MPNANQVLPLVGDRPADCVRQRPGADETERLTLVGTRVLQEERAVDVAVLTHHGPQRTADRVELRPRPRHCNWCSRDQRSGGFGGLIDSVEGRGVPGQARRERPSIQKGQMVVPDAALAVVPDISSNDQRSTPRSPGGEGACGVVGLEPAAIAPRFEARTRTWSTFSTWRS